MYISGECVGVYVTYSVSLFITTEETGSNSNTSNLYSGDIHVESWSRHLLLLLYLLTFPIFFRQMPKKDFRLGHSCFLLSC
jgi:hypothetical protein